MSAQSWPLPPQQSAAAAGASAQTAAADFAANLAARGRSTSVTRGPRTPGGSRTRYGSRSGRRSVDRSRSDDDGGENVRMAPAGQQERLDWLDAMNNTKNAVDTVERQQRKAAQDLATTEARVQELNTRLLKLENLGLESRMKSVEERVAEVNQKADKTFNSLCEACRNIVGTYVTIENNKDLEHMLDAKVDSVTVAVQALMSTVASLEIPQNRSAHQEFEIATPVVDAAAPPGIDPMQHDDAWARTHERMAHERMAGGEPAATSVPVPNSPFNNPQQSEQPGPRMPQQHAPGGQPIPPRPTTFAALPQHHAAMPAQQSPFQTPQPRGNAAAASYGHNVELMGNQRAMNRENKSLYRFSGHSADFKDWRDRFINHMAMVHVTWRSTLIWMGQTGEDLTYSRLRHETMGPNDENSCELAVNLEQTICNYLPAGLYGRRVQLCGECPRNQQRFQDVETPA